MTEGDWQLSLVLVQTRVLYSCRRCAPLEHNHRNHREQPGICGWVKCRRARIELDTHHVMLRRERGRVWLRYLFQSHVPTHSCPCQRSPDGLGSIKVQSTNRGFLSLSLFVAQLHAVALS